VSWGKAAAREIFNLHIAADRHTPQSVPLKIMSWLWEQSVRSQNPGTVGAPNVLFDLLRNYAPTIDWFAVVLVDATSCCKARNSSR
jgi:hypothetical protein